SRGLAVTVVLAVNLEGLALYAQQEATTPRAVTVKNVSAVLDLHDPQISPDGQWVAYAMGTVNRDDDKNEERIWMVPATGGEGNALKAGKGFFFTPPA